MKFDERTGQSAPTRCRTWSAKRTYQPASRQLFLSPYPALFLHLVLHKSSRSTPFPATASSLKHPVKSPAMLLPHILYCVLYPWAVTPLRAKGAPQGCSCSLVLMVSHLDHGAEAFLGEPWENPGHIVPFSKFLIWVPAHPWASLLPWAGVDGPLMG